MGEEVKLLGLWASPFSCRVELALKLKGVTYDYQDEDIKNKSPLLLKSNPVYKKIPVLLHKGKSIPESQIILEYIDETWDGFPIMPRDPYDRAQARFFAKFIDDKCVPTLWKACWAEGEEQKTLMEQCKENLKILEGQLKGKKFFGGETIGMVDIVANFIAVWVGVLQEFGGISIITEEKHPAIWKWSQEFVQSYDFVKDCLPDKEKLLALYDAMARAKKASA